MLDDRRISTEVALRKVLNDMNIMADTELFKFYMQKICSATFYIRAYIREEIIRYLALSDIRLDLFGGGWDKLGDLGNITYHGQVPYNESLKLCLDSKISLNVMPLFRNGLHDRIPTAMLCGSAVMTDSSAYIEEIFDTKDNKEILLYDAACPWLIADKLTEALSHEDELYEISLRGMKKATEKLSWDERAKEIIDIIDKSL